MATLRGCVRKMKSLRGMMSDEARDQFDSDVAEIKKRKEDFGGDEVAAVADFLEEQEFALDDIYVTTARLAGVDLPAPVIEPKPVVEAAPVIEPAPKPVAAEAAPAPAVAPTAAPAPVIPPIPAAQAAAVTETAPESLLSVDEDEPIAGGPPAAPPPPPAPPSGPDSQEGFSSEERRFMNKIGRPDKKEPLRDRYNRIKQNLGLKLRQGLVDQYASFKGILQDDRAWMMGHLTKSHTGALEAMIENGSLFIDGGVIGVDTETKGLKEVLEPLGANLDRFMGWIAANRANRLKGEERENLFTEEEIAIGMAMNEGYEELFEEVREEFESLGASVTQIAVDTGLIAAEEAEMWREEGFYLPFYRVMDDIESFQGPRVGGNTGLVKQEAYKKLKGGTQNVNDLLENMLLNWNHLLSASLNNQAATQALTAAEEMGLATPILKTQAGENAIYIRVDGKEQWYEIEDTQEGNLVLDSLLSLNFNGLNGPLMKAGRAFKRALTIGVTASPKFKIRNLIRDSITAIAVTGMDVNIAKNLYQGFKATGDPETQAQMLAGGGIFGDSGYFNGADPEAIKYLVQRGVKRDTILDTRWRIKKVFDIYQDWGARGENINRAADYVQSLNEGAEDILTRTFESRDHLDFTRTGTFTIVRGLAQLVPFLNARLQGLDKLGRASMKEGQKARFFTVTGVYSAMSVAIYLAMKDDEDYKATEQWERDSYHLFKLPGSDVMYRIVRPFEVGAIGSMAERIAEQMVDDEVHGALFAERLAHALTDTFSFNPTPQALKPALEVAMNKNWFTGRGIESQSMARLSPENRKRAWTSETAIAASEAMATISWDKVVLSPVQIEHLVRGYLGWLGSTAMAATDTLVTRPIIGAPVKPEGRLTDYSLGFAKSGPMRNTKYTKIFYERLGEINTAYADIRQAKQIGDMEEARALYVENKDKLKLRKVYTDAQFKLGKINKKLSKIQRSTTLTAKEKRIKMDRLTMSKNRVTRLISKRSKDL